MIERFRKLKSLSNLFRPAGETQVPAPSAALRAWHLLTLSAFALAQPIYDRASDRAGFLSDRGVEGPAIVALVLLLSVGVPLLLLLLEWCVNRVSPRAGPMVRVVVNDVLFTAIALPFLKRLDPLPGLLVLALALGGGAATAWAYEHFTIARRFVTVASPGAVLFPVWFLFFSSARGILIPPPESRFAIPDPVPIVMVVFDEFCGYSLMGENRELDEARFPGFAELSRHATWFRNATSVHPLTEYAVPALLSGNYIRHSASAPVVANYPQNLFTLIRNSKAYEIAAFEPVTRLCADLVSDDGRLKPGIREQLTDVVPTLGLVYAYHLSPTEWHKSLPEIPRAWFGLVENVQVDRDERRGVFRYSWGHDRDQQFAHFLDCLSDSDEPTLYYSHVLIPHVPWCYLPSGRKYAEDGEDWDLLNFDVHGEAVGDWGTDELYMMHNQARYLLQIGFADRLIGQLIDRLKAVGLFDRCLLVVTADHGVSFRPEEARRWLDEANLQDLMPIPLFIKRPGQQTGAVSDKNVETIDILPTIADVLGTPLPKPVDGWSAFDDSRPERQQKSMHDGPRSYVATARPYEKWFAESLGVQRFGSGRTRPNGLYEFGPNVELIGRPLDDFKITEAKEIDVELTRFHDVLSEDAAAIVPCHIEGKVRGAPGSPVELAIAVGGKIQAVTRTYLLGGLNDTWTAMIPESCLSVGKNTIEVFVVSSSDQQIRLRRPMVRRSERH